MGVRCPVVINCMVRAGALHEFDGAALCDAMSAVAEQNAVCQEVSYNLSAIPRVFLLDREMPPTILHYLENHQLPGVLTAKEWFRLRDLESHCYPFLRIEVAESLGFERLPYFASENYAAYNPEMALPELLVRYLTAFDAWKRARS